MKKCTGLKRFLAGLLASTMVLGSMPSPLMASDAFIMGDVEDEFVESTVTFADVAEDAALSDEDAAVFAEEDLAGAALESVIEEESEPDEEAIEELLAEGGLFEGDVLDPFEEESAGEALPEETDTIPESEEAAAQEEIPAADEETLVVAEEASEPAEEIPGGTAEESAATSTEEFFSSEEVASVGESLSDQVTAADGEETEAVSEDEKASWPAASFTDRNDAKNITVRVSAGAGTFPAGTTMSVTDVEQEIVDKITDEANGLVDGSVITVVAVDISFYDAEGTKIEPAKEISVSITPNRKVKAELAEADVLTLVHLPDETPEAPAAVTELVDTEKIAGEVTAQGVSFASDQFSVYAIIGSGSTEDGEYRATYKFQNSDGSQYWFYDTSGRKVDNQIIKDNEYLEDVGIPAIAGNQTFLGWFVYDTATGEFGDKIEFETAIPWPTGVEENYEVTVRAKYSSVYYVNYFADAEGTLILTRDQVTVVDGAATTIDLSKVSATAPLSTLAFVGWSDETGTAGDSDSRVPITPDVQTITKDMDYYPIFKSAHWISFVTGPVGSGATYVAPAFVQNGAAATDAEPAGTIKWKGYNFEYWTAEDQSANYVTATDEEGNKTYSYTVPETAPAEFDFNQVLTEDITLYAYWTDASAKYRVIYWHQNITDDKDFTDAQKTYANAGQAERTETARETVYTTAADRTAPTGFEYNAEKSDVSAVVAPDGTTVLNVYFDRKLITMNFTHDVTEERMVATTAETGTQYGLVDGEYVQLTRNTRTETVRGLSQTQNGTTEYTGTVYEPGNSWSGYVEASTPYSENNTYYYYTGGWFGSFERLYWSNVQKTVVYWSLPDGTEYTGTRFVSTEETASVTDQYTGLYGQTLQQNGYTWPDSIWSYANDQGGTTGMSYLGEFVLPDGVADVTGTTINFTEGDAENTSRIDFYLQNKDGSTYPASPSDTGFVSQGGTFYFSEKYEAFNVVQYRLYRENAQGVKTYYHATYHGGRNPYWEMTQNDGWVDCAVDDYVGMSGYIGGNTRYYFNLEIRYARKSHQFKYLDSDDGSPLATLDPVTVYYDVELSGYKPTAEQESAVVPQVEGKVFDGWYANQACTVPFDWTQTMPNSDYAVYAGWKTLEFWVKIDPNGGQLPAGASTYFWEDYGELVEEYANTTREYVEDPNGTWYYHYDEFNTETEEGPATGTRNAFYTQDASLSTDGSKTYKPVADAYAKIGWYKVEADGSLTPYNFGTPLKENLELRCMWRKLGNYRVVYELGAVDKTGQPLLGEDGNQKIECIEVPRDGNSYEDQSDSAFLGKPTIPAGYIFDGWYYDNKVSIPGDVFVVDAKYADENSYIHVYPVLTKIDSVPVRVSHVTWYANGGEGEEKPTETKTVTFDGEELTITAVSYTKETVTDENLQLNETIPIRGADTFTNEEAFLGWAKLEEPETFAPQDLGADDLYLKYDEDNNRFLVKDDKGEWVETTQLGMDEENPVEALYAVWDKSFKVYYTGRPESGTNPVKVRMSKCSGTYDLTQGLTPATLYGGYYVGEGVEKKDTTAPYNGTNWTFKVGAGQTTPGNAITPVAGTTYYVKEVPHKYLRTRMQFIADTLIEDQITRLFLVTAVDDLNYAAVGFDFSTNGGSEAATPSDSGKLYDRFVFTKKSGGETIGQTVVTLQELFTSLPGGYLGITKIFENAEGGSANTNYTAKPYWKTPDGAKVTIETRSYTTGDGKSSSLKKTGASAVITREFPAAASPNGLLGRRMALSSSYVSADVATEEAAAASPAAKPDAGGGESTEAPAAPEDTGGDEDAAGVTITKIVDGETTGTETVKTIDVAAGVEAPREEGKIFAGWYADEACTQAADPGAVAEDGVLYARFVDEKSVTVKLTSERVAGKTGICVTVQAETGIFTQAGVEIITGGKEYELTELDAEKAGGLTALLMSYGKDSFSGNLVVDRLGSFSRVTVQPWLMTADGTKVELTKSEYMYLLGMFI